MPDWTQKALNEEGGLGVLPFLEFELWPVGEEMHLSCGLQS